MGARCLYNKYINSRYEMIASDLRFVVRVREEYILMKAIIGNGKRMFLILKALAVLIAAFALASCNLNHTAAKPAADDPAVEQPATDGEGTSEGDDDSGADETDQGEDDQTQDSGDTQGGGDEAGSDEGKDGGDTQDGGDEAGSDEGKDDGEDEPMANASDLEFNAKWVGAIDLLLNKGASSGAAPAANEKRSLTSKSGLQPKGAGDLKLQSDFGFRISMEAYDYSGDSTGNISNVITPDWFYQTVDSGYNYSIMSGEYRGISISDAYYPAYTVGYSVGDVSYHACKESKAGSGASSSDPSRIIDSWYYKIYTDSDLYDPDLHAGLEQYDDPSNGKKYVRTIWNSRESGRSVYSNLCDLLGEIKDHPEKAVYNETTGKYDMRGIAYFETDLGTEDYVLEGKTYEERLQVYDDFIEELGTDALITFDDEAPASAKIARPVLISVGFDDEDRISSVSSDVVNEPGEIYYMGLFLEFGRRSMSIEYLDSETAICEIEGLPASSLSGIPGVV